MTQRKASDEEFITAYRRLGSPKLVADTLNMSVRRVQERRRYLQSTLGISLDSWNDASTRRIIHSEGRIDLSVNNGSILVFSDAHFWPGFKTTAFRALLMMIKTVPNLKAIICNGDAFDGASISRFPVMQWLEREKKPAVLDELNACMEALGEIERLAKCDLLWPIGNHDQRFEARLASGAPEYGGIHGFHLKDHFPRWRPCWTIWINKDVLVCHRQRNGIHATHTNVQANHHTTVTGHLHSLKVVPYTDGKGVTKWGVDTGTLADPMGPQFIDYMEGKQGNWRSGFALLTFHNGELLDPELVRVKDEDHVVFRGHLLHADTGKLV